MPELPEVETVCRGLEPAMAGRALRSRCRAPPRLAVSVSRTVRRTAERNPCPEPGPAGEVRAGSPFKPRSAYHASRHERPLLDRAPGRHQWHIGRVRAGHRQRSDPRSRGVRDVEWCAHHLQRSAPVRLHGPMRRGPSRSPPHDGGPRRRTLGQCAVGWLSREPCERQDGRSQGVFCWISTSSPGLATSTSARPCFGHGSIHGDRPHASRPRRAGRPSGPSGSCR